MLVALLNWNRGLRPLSQKCPAMPGRVSALAFAMIFLCLGFIEPAVAQSGGFDKLVKKYDPQALIDDQRKMDPNQEPYIERTYILADLTGSGTKEIVAAYGDGISAIVRVISQSGKLLAEVSKPTMITLDVELKAHDLNGDGKQEVMLVGSANRGPSKDWLFTWRNAGLVLISPVDTSMVLPETALHGASVMDIDGNGTPDLLGESPDPDDNTTLVYDMIGESLKKIMTISAMQFFYLNGYQTGIEKADFDVDDDSVPYSIRLLNGDDSGKASQVTAATVSVDGKSLFTPQDFNNHERLLTKTTRLAKHNTLSVNLAGKIHSGITIYAVPITQ